MDKYRLKLKVRMAWWILWWSLCALFLFAHIVEVVVGLIGLVPIGGVYFVPIKLTVFVIFGWLTTAYFPSVEKLLEKDIKKKEPYSDFANAITLERKILISKKIKKKERESKELRDNIKKMKAELEQNENENKSSGNNHT